MNPLRRIRDETLANKQFVAVGLAVLLATTAFAGTPGGPLLSGVGGRAAPPPAVPPPASPSTSPAPDTSGATDVSAAPAPPGPGDDALGATPGPLELPPPFPDEPPVACATDAVTDTAGTVRSSLQAATGQPVPGDSVDTLAAIAAGCSDEDPTGALVDLALELAALTPDPGLDTIDVPDLPPLPGIPVPPELTDALAPVAPAVREGCAQLALVSLLLVVLPPAFHVPIGQSDLLQLLRPASAVCALFDEAPA